MTANSIGDHSDGDLSGAIVRRTRRNLESVSGRQVNRTHATLPDRPYHDLHIPSAASLIEVTN